MVQRKVPSKLGIQADHVKSEKRFTNLKLSTSQLHQDGKSRGADMKRKMKKSKSIKLSDLQALQSSPSKKSLSLPGKPPPLCVPNTAASPQRQQPLMRTTDGSPNYMKPTSSSDAKKELFPVSLRNSQSGLDCKNQTQKISSNSKASSASCKKPAKNLTRSSSSKLVRTLTKTPSFKPSRACPRKSSTAALCADMNAQRATCSSTLKDSKFPAYLTLNPGGTESEGTSVMKVCPYTYCSLNGHRHAALPPLKSFLSARRRLLKTQKSMKLEAVSPPRWKVSCETNKEPDIEKNVFIGKAAYDEADSGNPIVTPLIQETGMDFVIEIYAKEKEIEAKLTEGGPLGDQMGEADSAKELEDQEYIKSAIEENNMAAQGDDDVKQIIARISGSSAKSEIDSEEDFKKYFDDVAIEADTKGSFLQEIEAEYADEDQPPIWCHDEISMGSYSSEISYDGEHLDNSESDGSGSEATDMEWEGEQFCAAEHKEDIDSFILTEEEPGSKVEFLSDCSNDVSGMWLDEIISSYYEEMLVDDVSHEANAEENACFDAQSHGTEEVLPELINAEENCGEDETYVTEKQIKELTESNEDNEGKNVAEVERLMIKDSLELWDDETNCITEVLHEALEENQEDMSLQQDGKSVSLVDQPSDVSQACYELNQVETGEDSERQEIKNAEAPQDNAANYLGPGKEVNADSEEAKVTTQLDKDYDDSCEALMVDNSQGHKTSETDETSEDRNSSLETNDGSIREEMQITLSDMHEESTCSVEDHPMLEKDQCKANEQQSRSCNGVEEQNTSKNWMGAIRRKRPVQDDEEMRKFNPREPNFLPVVPDPEAEKVDLKHQMMDERKNAEEWMLDYALRQAVTKLAPARKRKVALLVEAFETVIPIPKFEARMRSNSGFAHARPIQACS